MANTKITALTENTSRDFNDLLPMVDDPAGTPLTQKMKFVNATGLIVNAQTGTTYTYLTGDYGKLVTHTNGSAIAGTLPQAGASFPANWFMYVQNRGVGAVTITPTTSTIDGAATLVLNTNEGALIVSDGSNYFTFRGKTVVGGSGGAPADATYITQTSNGSLSAEQALGLLATGILKSTTTTGVVSIATATDLSSPVAAADAGASDTYTATLAPAPAAYADGVHYRFKANTANTGACTINFNSLGAKTIKKVIGGITTDLSDNDIRAGQWVEVVYDGTNMQMQSTLGNAPGGAPSGSAGGDLSGTYPNPTVIKTSLTAAHGSDDTWTGTTIAGLNAGATIAQWEAVYLDGSSTWQLADANGTNTYPARGLATAAYSNTNPAVILVHGTVRNDAWNWTPGGTIYISGTPGALTQTAPSTSGDKVQQVGFALTADIAFFDFNNTYLTVT